jgi:hypothetical protein
VCERERKKEKERKIIYLGKWNFEPNFHVKNPLFHDHMFSQPIKLVLFFLKYLRTASIIKVSK